MSLNRLPDYLDHMRQAITDAQSFTEGMAQGYFDINLEVVWDTVPSALPELKSQLDALPSA